MLVRVDESELETSTNGYGDVIYRSRLFTGIGVEYQEGQCIHETGYYQGWQHGRARTWDTQGVLREEVFTQRNTEHGMLRVWNASGVLTREAIYEYGLLIFDEGRSLVRGAFAQRWKEERASRGQQPYIDIVDDEFVEVPWPYDDRLPI